MVAQGGAVAAMQANNKKKFLAGNAYYLKLVAPCLRKIGLPALAVCNVIIWLHESSEAQN
jgi:hypothetical protein